MTLDGSLAPPSPLDVGTGKWVEGPDQALRVLADDPSGSGPASATFAIDGTEIATRTQNCADFPCWLLADYSVDASVYAAGDHAAVVTVKDAVGNTKTYAWSIHVDPQPPDLTVGGSLDASEAHATSASPTYQLAIQASDGSGIPAQSGVDHVEVRIDGHTQGTVDSTCSAEPCTTSRTLEFTPQELAPGAHDVAVVAYDRAGNTTRRAWTVTTSADADVLCPTPTTTAQMTSTSPPQQLSTNQAVASAQDAAAPVVAPTDPTSYDSQTVSPTVTTDACSHAIVADDTLSPSAVDKIAGGSLHLDTGWGDLTMTPATVTGATTAPEVTAAGDASISANTSPATDTIIRPTALGAETITEIRGSAAPQTFTWDVALPDGESLAKLSDGSVAVTTPATPDATTPGEPAAPDTATPAPGVTVAPVYGATPMDAATGTQSAVMPTGVDQSQMPPVDDGSTPPDAPPVQPDPAIANLTAVEKVPVAQAQLETGTAALESAQAQTSDDVVAVIRAPWARDANGNSVPASLDVNGPQVTMTVEHQAGDAYPITADPDLVDCKHVNPCGTFDWRKAGGYAREWAHGRNSDYASFSNDCTNFVSEALRAGDMWWMRNWSKDEGSWWSRKVVYGGRAWYDQTDSWRLVQVLYHHLDDYHLDHRIVSTDDARVGDLIFYDFGDHGDEWDHVDIITGSDGNQPLVTGHTVDKKNAGFYTTIVNRARREHGQLVPLDQHFSAPHHRLTGRKWTYMIMRVTKQGANIAK
jgi:hypothetical protein